MMFGFQRLDFDADRRQLVLHAEEFHLVAAGAQRRRDVVFGLPAVDLLLGVALERVGRDERRMGEREDAERFHRANHCRRDGL